MIPVLAPTKQKLIKIKTIGFDIETYDNNKKFLMASLVADDWKRVYFNQKDLIEDLKSKKCWGSFIVASNLSFDFFGTFFNHDELMQFTTLFRGSDLMFATTYIENGQFIKKPKKQRKGKITFIDTFNFVKMSVEKLGKIINIEKLKSPDFIGKKPKNKKEWDEMIAYNIRDSEVSKGYIDFLFKALQQLGGNPQKTIASSAMSVFKCKYLKDRYFRLPSAQLLDIFQSYYGGRTEAFSRGYIKNYNYYDINSLYPYVMTKKYPDPNSIRFTQINTLENIQNFDGVSNVEISTPQIAYPVLPLRDRDKVIFGYGTLIGTWTHLELRKAIEDGATIKKVNWTYWFAESCYPFREYVTDLYQKRLDYKHEGNPMEQVVKILLNSLYGKFGQKFIDKDNWIPFNHTIEELSKLEFFERIGSFIRVKKAWSRPPAFCIPIWATYVTAYARLELLKYIRKYNPVYCDTDSIITKDTIPTSEKLGAMKLEMKVKKGIIVRPKFYGLVSSEDEEYVKIKGLGKRLSFKQYSDFLNTPSFTYDKFMKFKESLRRGFIPNEIQSITKNMSLEDDKRIWPSYFNRYKLQHSKPQRLLEGIREKDYDLVKAQIKKREEILKRPKIL